MQVIDNNSVQTSQSKTIYSLQTGASYFAPRDDTVAARRESVHGGKQKARVQIVNAPTHLRNRAGVNARGFCERVVGTGVT